MSDDPNKKNGKSWSFSISMNQIWVLGAGALLYTGVLYKERRLTASRLNLFHGLKRIHDPDKLLKLNREFYSQRSISSAYKLMREFNRNKEFPQALDVYKRVLKEKGQVELMKHPKIVENYEYALKKSKIIDHSALLMDIPENVKRRTFRRRLLLLMVLYVWYLIIRDQRDGRLASWFQASFFTNSAKDLHHQTQKTFKDVKGIDEFKSELEELVRFLKNPAKYEAAGAKMPKGVLMTGPPGTGKTLLAKAVAGEAEVPFFYKSGSEFDEVFVGVGASRVREIFKTAKENAPCIIFIDEIDVIGGKRTSKDAGYARQSINQLLVEMDGFEANKGVLIIGATNFPESLDSALTRPGRFDKTIGISLPTLKGRVEILDYYLSKLKTPPELNVTDLARGIPGFSGADIENYVNQAIIHAVNDGRDQADKNDFDYARDRILMGVAKKSHKTPEETLKNTAFHECGHTLTAMLTKGAHPVHKVTIVPRGHSLGMTSYLPENDIISMTHENILANIDVAMGGRVAEHLIFGERNVTTGCSDDLRKATDLAYSSVRRFGMTKTGFIYADDSPLGEDYKTRIDEEVKAILNESYERVYALLSGREKELRTLADELFEKETLDNDEIKKIVNLQFV